MNEIKDSSKPAWVKPYAVATFGREPSDLVAGLELQWIESGLKDLYDAITE